MLESILYISRYVYWLQKLEHLLGFWDAANHEEATGIIIFAFLASSLKTSSGYAVMRAHQLAIMVYHAYNKN